MWFVTSGRGLIAIGRFSGVHVSWKEHSDLLEQFFELAKFGGKTNERIE